MSRLRLPVFCWTASRVSSWSASKRLAIRADQRLQAGTDDGNDGAIVLDVEIDVPVVVDDVEQSLEVIRGDVALLHEQAG